MVANNLSILDKLRLIRKTFVTNSWRLYNSQFGEDIALRQLPEVNSKEFGFYVDVGCWHPRKFSNTYFLSRRGWRGLNVDVDPEKIFCFRLARPKDENIVAAVSDRAGTGRAYTDRRFSLGTTIESGSAGKDWSARDVTTRTLSEILDDSRYRDLQIDVLSVDAEGHDLQVLKGLDFDRYRPRIILVEFHASSLDDVVKSKIHELLAGNAYELINWVGPTLIYRMAGS